MELWGKQIGCVRTGIWIAIASVISTSAIDPIKLLAQTLPPPPPRERAPLPTVAPSAPLPTIPVQPIPGQPRQPQIVPPTPNERVFEAPRPNPVQLSPGRFRVLVENDSPFVLQQVRSIQPDAFIQTIEGRRVIQAGLFSSEINARQQVALLANQGVRARVTTQGGQSIGDVNTGGGYMVVIPGSRDDLQTYYSRVIQLGISQSAIRMRDHPRGLHLAVGPFANRREAERVSGELRDRGNMDARVFYDR